MKIAIISNFFTPLQTGSCYWARQLAENHQAKGDDVVVITASREKIFSDKLESGVRVIRLPYFFRLPKLNFFMNFDSFFLINSRANRRKVEQILLENGIEVVHTSNHLLDAIFLTRTVCKKLKLPFLCTIQGVISHAGNRFYSWVMRFIDKVLIKPCMDEFDVIVSLDKENKDYVDQIYRAKRSELIPLTCLGTDFFAKFAPAVLANDSKKIRIASVGHVTENRNRCELVRALPKLIEAGFSPKLEIIGRKLSSVAETLAISLGVSDYVTFVGEMNRDAVLEHLRQVDIEAHLFFMPGLGCASLEAMAIGLPTIVFGYPGLYGTVPLEHGKNIFFADPYAQETVDRVLLDLARSSQLRRDVGTGARKLVSDHLTWDHTIARYREIYADLCKVPRPDEPAKTVQLSRISEAEA